MSALARIARSQGCQVSGSDQKPSALLDQLSQEGICVRIGHSSDAIPKGATVVYTSDLKGDNEEWIAAKKQGLQVLHRSDFLDLLLSKKKPLLVTGTHGKTTTTALLAWTLKEACLDPSFVVGGILRSLGINGRFGQGPFFVAEADESDGSFLKTKAFGAIVTSLSNDHLDYWKSEERLETGFAQFFNQVQDEKYLFWCIDDSRLQKCLGQKQGVSYGFSNQASLQITYFEQRDEGILFDFAFEGKTYPKICLPLLGRHNGLNGAGVFGLALRLGIAEEKIRQAFASFQGTCRRMEWKGEVHALQVFDDYAHHPREIKTTLAGLRSHIREKRMVAVFQPHRYTRVQDLWSEFGSCFDLADLVVITEIYSAGEKAIDGINSSLFFDHMQQSLGSKAVFLPRDKLEEKIIDYLKIHDVVVTLGAGDITEAGSKILERWGNEKKRLKLAVLCGGTSAEHPVSIQSARNILEGCDPSLYELIPFFITKKGKWRTGASLDDLIERSAEEPQEKAIPISVLATLASCDVCIPVFHGPQGEDGMMQGLLEALEIPYAGCDYRACVLSMDKVWTKQISLMHGIPTAPFFTLSLREHREDKRFILTKIKETLSYPVWIKPVHLGSSLGVGQAKNEVEAVLLAEKAFLYDDQIIIEQHVEGKQIEFGILGNEYFRVGPPCEILNHGAFVDYTGKYGKTAMPYAIPANISSIQEALGIDLAKQVYRAIGCKGLARVDFFLDENGYYWLNEINPFPGCTDTSAFPKIWAQAGVSMRKICDDLVIYALHKARALQRVVGRE